MISWAKGDKEYETKIKWLTKDGHLSHYISRHILSLIGNGKDDNKVDHEVGH